MQRAKRYQGVEPIQQRMQPTGDFGTAPLRCEVVDCAHQRTGQQLVAQRIAHAFRVLAQFGFVDRGRFRRPDHAGDREALGRRDRQAHVGQARAESFENAQRCFEASSQRRVGLRKSRPRITEHGNLQAGYTGGRNCVGVLE